MGFLKKVLPLVILLLFVFGWYLIFYSPKYPKTVKVSGTENNLSLFIQPEDGKAFLVDGIKAARKEVLVEVYLLSDRDVITALEDSFSNGNLVQVILECHPFGGGNINTKTKKELESKKIPTKCASDKFALTHEKAVIVDASTAYILSQNITPTSFSKNREYDVMDINKQDVDEVRNIFMADWNNTSFTPTDNNIIESPNTARAGLTDLINGAKAEIDIEAEVIDDAAMTNLLLEKAKTVKVKMIFPTLKQISANKKDIDLLVAGGVEVKTTSSPYMHAKMIMVDNSKVYTGSINLSSASMDENREVGIIYTQNDVVQRIGKTFDGDWEKAVITGI